MLLYYIFAAKDGQRGWAADFVMSDIMKVIIDKENSMENARKATIFSWIGKVFSAIGKFFSRKDNAVEGDLS